MTSTFPHELKEFVLKDFQKNLDDEPAIRGKKLTVEDYFHFFHETDFEETFNELLIEGNIKAINEYLFRNLYVIKFFETKNYHKTDDKKASKQLLKYVRDEEMKRTKLYNN